MFEFYDRQCKLATYVFPVMTNNHNLQCVFKKGLWFNKHSPTVEGF